MKPIAFVDLDDTLFQTRGKVVGYEDEQLTVGARAKNGRNSYMTPVQKNMVDWLLASAEVIPVTARSSEEYSRVEIPFSSYVIISNGAVILDADGAVDKEWQMRVHTGLEPIADYMEELLEAGNAAAASLGVSVRSWAIKENGVTAYVAFKENDGDGSRLQEIAPMVELDGWVRHHNGNNLALIPPVISKRLAVEFLLERMLKEAPDRPVLGYGDSVTDMSYLSLCDWWSAPRRSQITAKMIGG